jgi:hypothetical protein
MFTSLSGGQVTPVKQRRYFTSVIGIKKLASFNPYQFFPVTVQLLTTDIYNVTKSLLAELLLRYIDRVKNAIALSFTYQQ